MFQLKLAKKSEATFRLGVRAPWAPLRLRLCLHQ